MTEKIICDICEEELLEGYKFKGKRISLFHIFDINRLVHTKEYYENFDICKDCLKLIKDSKSKIKILKSL